MKYIAAYCLVALSGKDLCQSEVKKVLESVNVQVDEQKLSQLCESLRGKQLNEVIAAGLTKVGSFVSGSQATGNSSGAPKQEEKKEEVKEEEEEEEEDVDMGDLFGDF